MYAKGKQWHYNNYTLSSDIGVVTLHILQFMCTVHSVKYLLYSLIAKVLNVSKTCSLHF